MEVADSVSATAVPYGPNIEVRVVLKTVEVEE
jgi:hypothetical protein